MDNRIRQRRAHGELERRLETYAAARLSPDPRQMARIRTAVMTEARRTLAGPSLLALPVALPQPLPLRARPASRRRFSSGGWRRTTLALAAASLAGLLLGGTAFAASRAGAPLYGVRVWLEAATLPADREARAAAELSRLQSRLGDVADGAARGDGSAVSAALAEYRASRVVLASLLGMVPSTAQDAIQQVLDRDQHALDAIRLRGQPGSNGSGAPAAKPDGAGGAAPPTQKPAAQPTAPPHVDTTARPEHTPRSGLDSHGAKRGN